MDVTGEEWGVGIGIRHFMEEYPKELTLDVDSQRVQAYLWSSAADPMSFERWSSEEDGGMVDNFAQGLTKTTELVYRFHADRIDLGRRRREVHALRGMPYTPSLAHLPLGSRRVGRAQVRTNHTHQPAVKCGSRTSPALRFFQESRYRH
jgi:hypothetical protein